MGVLPIISRMFSITKSIDPFRKFLLDYISLFHQQKQEALLLKPFLCTVFIVGNKKPFCCIVFISKNKKIFRCTVLIIKNKKHFCCTVFIIENKKPFCCIVFIIGNKKPFRCIVFISKNKKIFRCTVFGLWGAILSYFYAFNNLLYRFLISGHEFIRLSCFYRFSVPFLDFWAVEVTNFTK